MVKYSKPRYGHTPKSTAKIPRIYFNLLTEVPILNGKKITCTYLTTTSKALNITPQVVSQLIHMIEIMTHEKNM
jgi:hypothetical protein